jgi:hypothetical protein
VFAYWFWWQRPKGSSLHQRSVIVFDMSCREDGEERIDIEKGQEEVWGPWLTVVFVSNWVLEVDQRWSC